MSHRVEAGVNGGENGSGIHFPHRVEVSVQGGHQYDYNPSRRNLVRTQRQVQGEFERAMGSAGVVLINSPKAERNLFLIISGSGAIAVGLFLTIFGICAKFNPNQYLNITHFKPLMISGGILLGAGGIVLATGLILPDEISEDKKKRLAEQAAANHSLHVTD